MPVTVSYWGAIEWSMASSSAFTQQAACAVHAVAYGIGLSVQRLKALGGYANIMFKLEPYPIVARVAGSASAVRTGDDWLARELELAEYLRNAGINAVRPWREFSPGPYEHQGLHLTFWEYLDISSEAVSPAQLGNSLRQLHIALQAFAAPLPVMGALEETWAILDRPELRTLIAAQDWAVIVRKSEEVRNSLYRWKMRCRPIHGDAHHGNLWQTNRGLTWGDFEDAHLGPVEWDLACMTASSMVFGKGEAADIALRAYAGSYDINLLELLIDARTLQAIAWAAITLTDPANNIRFRRRIEWLAC